MNRATAEEMKAAPREAARVLENADIRVEVVPELGGKFISLRSKRSSIEWLLPPLRPYAEARASAGFEHWDGGGFDECLPTVAATETAQDHGEVWRHAWREKAKADSVLLWTTALEGAVTFERRAQLNGATLVLDYAVQNRSGVTQSLLYCAHPLHRVEQGDRILLPAEVQDVKVEGSAGDRLGRRGDRIGWPRVNTGDDLSVIGPLDGLQADKIFAGPLTHGWCALVRPSAEEGLELTFSSDVLPYVGLWICRGAWPDSGTRKQYTVAFEPTNAPHDSLAEAENDGSAWQLAPAERRAWTLRFRIGSRRELESHAQLRSSHDRD
jgi:hypothetical protein